MRNPTLGASIYNYDTNVITVKDAPEFDGEEYDLDNEKELVKYLKAVERSVRGSFEYKEMIKYLRTNFNMTQSSFLDLSMEDLNKLKIEIHHDPFSLYDLCSIILRKRRAYHENLDVEATAQEVMMRHYNLMVGLIPLSTTEHELVHNSFLFVPTNKVFGNYKKFVELYKDFILPEEMDILKEIEAYTEAYNDAEAKKLFESNYVYIDTGRQLPPVDQLKALMQSRIDMLNATQSNNLIQMYTKKPLISMYRKTSE